MLDDLAVVVEPEDVDAGIVVIARPVLEAVEHDEVTLGDGSLYLYPFARPLARHALEVVDEALLARGDMRVVLDIFAPNKALYGTPWIAVVEHLLVEGDHIRLVALQVGHGTLHAVEGRGWSALPSITARPTIELRRSSPDQQKLATGARWKDVVHVNSYHVGGFGPEVNETMSRLYRQYMPDHAPIWTQLGVEALGLPEMRIEIRVTAIVP